MEELFRSPEPGYRNNRWSLKHVAADTGYRDGVSAGSQDRKQRRRFRPRQSAAWKNGVNGYDPAFVSQTAYRAAYRIAYEDGYQDGFGASR